VARGVFARLWREPVSAEVEPDPPLLDRLAEASAATLLINGCRDVRFVHDLGRRLSGGISDARRVDLDDTGHLPPVERPDAVTSALLDWLPR
jgi:pimeloyl-ACP methyl ester carboxylesterase